MLTIYLIGANSGVVACSSDLSHLRLVVIKLIHTVSREPRTDVTIKSNQPFLIASQVFGLAFKCHDIILLKVLFS